MIAQDKLWKAILEDFFPEAILFYFPDYFPGIDWSKGFEVLDKEQQQIFADSEESHRRVDMLTKVWLTNGQEQWILIHIEVQGYRDEDFAHRMFVYYYRLVDRFNKPISALAILTDKDKNWRPGHFETNCMQTSLTYRYPVFKLADHEESFFAGSDNPWAWIMRTALIGMKGNWDDQALVQVKVNLYREFRERGFSIEKTRTFLQFLKYCVSFEKREFFDKFDAQIYELDHQKNKTMGIIELVKEHLIEDAKKEGIEEGIEKGIEKGVEKGIEKGLSQGELLKARKVTIALINQFPAMTDDLIAKIVEMPPAFVQQIRQELKTQSQ
jgi:hypothetical protein